MNKRLLSGSLLGMSRSTMHSVEANPFLRIYLDAEVDSDRLSGALSQALSECPYMKCTLKAAEGIFLELADNDRPMPLLKGQPEVINCEENNGHSAGVYYKDNIIGVMVSHALTDGVGFFRFARTLLDYYFGEDEGIYRGYGSKDYDTDPMELELKVSDDYMPISLSADKFFTISPAESLSFDDTFILRMEYCDFKALCKSLNSSTQNVLTLLGMKALSEAYPDNEAAVVSRLPVNARNMFGIPDTFQNASLANMRICFRADELSDGKDEELLNGIKDQTSIQNNMDSISYQYIEWRKVLFAKDHGERMRLIVDLMGQDALLISNLGRGLIGEGYSSHVTAVHAGAMMFPLMVYGIVVGEKMFLTGYDAGDRDYKKALISILNRRDIAVEELDPATGKTV